MEKQFLFVDVSNPTWLVYIAVLVLAVFFRFSRLFTVRNLDVLFILALSTSLVIASAWKNIAPPGSADSVAKSNGTRLEGIQIDGAVQSQSGPADSDASNTLNGKSTHAVLSSPSTVYSESIAEKPQSEHVAGAQTENGGSDHSNTTNSSGSAPGADGHNIATDVNTGTDESTGTVAGNAVATSETSSTDSANEPSSGQAAGELSADQANASAEQEVSASGPQFHPVYLWSSGISLVLSFLLILRLIFDESLTRRPRLEQNLNQAGLTFLCIPAFALLTVGIFIAPPPNSALAAVEQGRALLQRLDVQSQIETPGEQPPAPTATLIAAGAAGVAQLSGQLPPDEEAKAEPDNSAEAWVAQVLVVISHTVVVFGLLYIGKHHFSSMQLGLSMACLYLLLPCTARNVHQLSHVLPGACLTWAIASYRKPVVAGVLLGLACGTLFFAVFLLPVWAAFYGRRGSVRFGLSLVGVAAILVVCLLLTSSNADSFMNKLVTTMNWTVYRLLDETGSAPETPFGQLFVRIPLAAVFFVMLTAMTVLPRPRNLENLLANSTALVVTAQLWYPDDIGAYVLWYLPLLLLVVFRPRLDRFTPPDVPDRYQIPVSQPTPAGAPSAVAMSRLTLYQ